MQGRRRRRAGREAAHLRCEEINGAAPPPTLKERLPDPAVLHGSARPRRRRADARVRGTRRSRAALLRDQRRGLPSIRAFIRQSRAGPVDGRAWSSALNVHWDRVTYFFI